jgi:hypothetical protein
VVNRIELVLGSVLIIAAGIGVWFLRARIGAVWALIKAKVKPFLQGTTFFRLGETFMNEAAVLWFVFPLLNVLYPEHTGNQQSLGWLSVLGTLAVSWSISGFLFIIGLVLGFLAEKKNLESHRQVI